MPLAVALMLFACPAVRADVPVDPPKEPTYPLVIEAYPKVEEARLIIPKQMLGKLKAELDQEEKGGIAGTSRMQTIIAGVAMTMALAFSGLWLVRRGPNGGRHLALLIGAVGFFGIGAAVMADGAVRPDRTPRTDKVVIQITDKGDEVKLIVNKGKLAKAIEEKK